MLQHMWQELDYRIDICRITNGGHIEHLSGRTETWCVSPLVDMLPFGVTIPATVPQRMEILEGLMNYSVLTCCFMHSVKGICHNLNCEYKKYKFISPTIYLLYQEVLLYRSHKLTTGTGIMAITVTILHD
jgi:hypothetical protein